MRCIVLFIAVNVLLSAVSFAQEDSQRDASPATSDPAVQSYVVQLTEFRLKSSSNPALTASDIVASFEQMSGDGMVDVVEIVRLSALAGFETVAQFGKMATVTVGVAQPFGGRGSARQIQNVGTVVRITAFSQEEKVLLKLTYEATRLRDSPQEDIPPDAVTVSVNTTLLIEPGKPTLVAGTSADATTFLLVSIGH